MGEPSYNNTGYRLQDHLIRSSKKDKTYVESIQLGNDFGSDLGIRSNGVWLILSISKFSYNKELEYYVILHSS